jgi:ATP-dependent RNA helicase DeaD
VRRTAETEPPPREGMERYRLEVGFAHGAKPGNILGAIANEAGLDGKDIGRITLFDDYSTVDLPEGMPADLFQHLKKVRVAGRPLNLSRQSDGAPAVTPATTVRVAPHAKAKAPSPHHKRGARPHPGKPKPRR